MERITERMGELLVNQNKENLNQGRIPIIDEQRNQKMEQMIDQRIDTLME